MAPVAAASRTLVAAWERLWGLEEVLDSWMQAILTGWRRRRAAPGGVVVVVVVAILRRGGRRGWRWGWRLVWRREGERIGWVDERTWSEQVIVRSGLVQVRVCIVDLD